MAAARFDKAKFLADYTRLHSGYERKSYKSFKLALDKQVQPVIDYLKAYGTPSDSVINMLIPRAPMETAYKQVYTDIGVKHAAFTYRRINALGKSIKSHPLSFFSSGWQRLMELFYTHRSSPRITDVTDTTRERVKKTLADNQDLTISQQASLLEDNNFNRSRALTIARTESTAAANYGASLGNADADYETNKQWMAVMDANTRPDHVDADGQTVANDELFIVGGESCMFPGDLSLSAKECVNCRCTAVYVPVLSGLGLPILKG